MSKVLWAYQQDFSLKIFYINWNINELETEIYSQFLAYPV